MQKSKAYFFLLLFFFALLFSFLVFSFTHPYTVQRIPVTVPVGNYVGVTVDTEALHFGTVKPGLRSERTVTLQSDKRERVFLKIGGIAFVSVEPEELLLLPGETVEARVTAYPGEETKEGTYTGTLVILSREVS